MKVKELREMLQAYDENKEIEISCTYDCGCGEAGGTFIQIIEKASSIVLFNDEC